MARRPCRPVRLWKVMPKSVAERPIRIAVDIGGTFTDLHVFDARTHQLHGWKTATTPADPSRGLMQGLREASDRFDFALADVGLLMHGTTVATNAVLERKLARGLLVTTEGFGLRIAAPILPRLTPVSLGQSETR